MKTKIPDNLKDGVPPTRWGKILSATPVIMTVVATMLAGLSSSEMTRAQYDRSLAAQQQSKAGDQWNFFQGKKLRGVVQRTSLDTLSATTPIRALDQQSIRNALAGTVAASQFETQEGRRALSLLADGTLPSSTKPPELESPIEAALKAIEVPTPDAEMAQLMANVDPTSLDKSLALARENTAAFDAQMRPYLLAIENMEKQLETVSVEPALRRDFIAARLEFSALRYDAEARMNQVIGGLYELQVRKSNISAERHHRRSARFFYGMLAAQMGVIISTLAMAARQRNLLWSLAAGAGAVAIAFAVYVYLYV